MWKILCKNVLALYRYRDFHIGSPPAQTEKIQDILQDILKEKNRTFYRTSEADFSTFVRHYCILAVFYK